MAKSWDAGSRWPKPWPQHKQHDLSYDWRNILPPAEPWMERAACVGRWPMWDRTVEGENEPTREARQERAARICRTRCPVMAQCRAWADRAETLGDFGVVAGRVVRGSINSRTQAQWVDLGGGGFEPLAS
ncbi:WhiB family transcriptional regulator [Dietzia cinnamea]|uniref:WhiB family transcriptional regulator n=1 Tax=Dietzia cinnamea TaxID=321318 RepID=UPI0021A7C634|nr:WhiB family transcriptional regulator [Dietzia cinnamea]MCT1884981.1 WhiB family transcriptional regulator [Dietzia cinnamea]